MYSYSNNTPAVMVMHDWDLFFICQSKENYKPIMNPESSVKLRNNPERLSACYKKVTDNRNFRSVA